MRNGRAEGPGRAWGGGSLPLLLPAAARSPGPLRGRQRSLQAVEFCEQKFHFVSERPGCCRHSTGALLPERRQKCVSCSLKNCELAHTHSASGELWRGAPPLRLLRPRALGDRGAPGPAAPPFPCPGSPASSRRWGEGSGPPVAKGGGSGTAEGRSSGSRRRRAGSPRTTRCPASGAPPRRASPPGSVSAGRRPARRGGERRRERSVRPPRASLRGGRGPTRAGCQQAPRLKPTPGTPRRRRLPRPPSPPPPRRPRGAQPWPASATSSSFLPAPLQTPTARPSWLAGWLAGPRGRREPAPTAPPRRRAAAAARGRDKGAPGSPAAPSLPRGFFSGAARPEEELAGFLLEKMSVLTMEAQCLDERGSFFKLIDTIASEIGELKQEMVQADLVLEDGSTSIQSLEKDMSDLCPDQKKFKSFPRDSGYDSLPNKLSILDKLLHTHPVWLQLGLSDTEAAEVLQTQPPGTFLVRKSTRMQKKVLSLRLPTAEFGSCLKEFAIKESTYTFSLEGSGISFADLFRLIAFYCISRDVLPFTLKLPRVIAAATTEAELEEVAQQGLSFWSSPANDRLQSPAPLQQPLPPDCVSKGSQQLCLINGVHSIRTRTPSELECSQTNGALCFINPLFLKVHSQDVGGNLKRPCLRTQDGNGLERSRSPPPRPPPPSIHSLLASPQLSRTVNQASLPESDARNKHWNLDLLQKRPTPIPPPRLKKKALSLEAESGAKSGSEGAQPSRHLVHGPETVSIPGGALPQQNLAGSLVACSESQVQCNGGRQRLSNMSLSTSSSDSLEFDRSMPLFAYDGDTNSSLEEYEGESDQESMAPPLKPKKKRSSSFVLPKIVKSQLRKVSGVFSSFMTPEKRMIKRIAEMSQDKRTYFGCLVQDYVSFLQENKECHVSSTDMLQTIRQFMTQVKSYLSQSSELDPPIESLIPEDQIDVVLEKAMHKSILKPLKGHIEAMLKEFHMADGSWKQLKENLQLVRQRNPQELGVFVPTPDFVDVEKIKVKFMTMQKMYSPEKKVMLLLRVCKLIYTVMENNSGRMYGADDFLPVLTYVVAQCDMLELDAEIEYMMELLDPSLLHGEGGYYLTSAYGALSLIKNFQEEQAARLLCSEARNTLRQWHKRRTTNRTIPSVDDFQNYLRVAFQEVSSGCTGKTLLVRPYITTEDVCRLCAEKFKVDSPDDYSLFLFIDDTWQQLTEDTYPQKIKAELHSRPQPQVFHFVYKRINSDPYGAVFQNDNSNRVS